jgi:Fe2+ or Zn2+ uptake regulation protein
MSASQPDSFVHRSALCRLGRHHHVRVQDQNPENLRAAHLECTRCGHIKEIAEYDDASGNWLTKGGPFVG